MDLLLILRDALASSATGTLLTAIAARESDRSVAVLVTQEALAAAARGSFEWPRELSGQTMRLAIADGGAAAGLLLLGRGEGRQLDVHALFARAREKGVALYACPVWTALLALEGRLPDGFRPIDRAALAALLQDARRVVGSL